MGVMKNHIGHAGSSQSSVDEDLQLFKSLPYASAAVRANLPHSFKSLLPCLAACGVNVESFTYDYDLCPGKGTKQCGFLYR